MVDEELFLEGLEDSKMVGHKDMLYAVYFKRDTLEDIKNAFMEFGMQEKELEFLDSQIKILDEIILKQENIFMREYSKLLRQDAFGG